MIGYCHHHVVRLSIRLSVTLCIVALRVGVLQGYKLYQRVPSRQGSICPFSHKMHQKNESKNANVRFLETIRRVLVVLGSVIR